jgi:carbon-monoxide dehydrogenase large subunit
MEHLIYDNNDQLLIGSFMDYAIPRASDIPPLIIATMSDPTPYNTLGARGVGESGAIGIPVAIMNAAVDAFCSLGKKELQMPITSQTFWKLL